MFFIFGFEKNVKSPISINEVKAFKIIAKTLLSYSVAVIEPFLKEGKLVEIKNE